MVSILEELGTEASSEDAFDVEDFVEMMEAYIPSFADIDRFLFLRYISMEGVPIF